MRPRREKSPAGETRDAGTHQGQELPQHVTLPLLSLITSQSMDQDYQHVAARRAREGADDPEERRRSRAVTGIVVGVFGVLVSVAAVQTSLNADVEALGRASLINRIQDEKADLRTLQDRAGELRAQNAAADDVVRRLREREEEISQRVSRLGVRTGYLAVRGPGLRITVDSAEGALDTQVVRDDDLLLLVDGLWAAGAEAVAINGQRLTTLSSIQNSGQAVHVNTRPLNPPYVVEAIGDPANLEARLLATTHGSVFYSVARTLGFTFDIEDDGEIELPAARPRALRHTEVGGGQRPGQKKEIDP